MAVSVQELGVHTVCELTEGVVNSQEMDRLRTWGIEGVVSWPDLPKTKHKDLIMSYLTAQSRHTDKGRMVQDWAKRYVPEAQNNQQWNGAGISEKTTLD